MKPPPPTWKERLLIVWRQYVLKDLRVTHMAIAGMVLLGIVVNLFLPHGWTVWPFVASAAILLGVHEAADRNGQGVPPFHVYVFFASAMATWFLVVLLLSWTNPLVLMLGFGIVAYYAARGHLKIREKQRVIAKRRAAGQCIYCGYLADPTLGVCMHCGREPDPELMRLQRVVATAGGGKGHARVALMPEAPATSARKKEQALLARRRRSHRA